MVRSDQSTLLKWTVTYVFSCYNFTFGHGFSGKGDGFSGKGDGFSGKGGGV